MSNPKSYSLQLEDGSWVGSPTHTTTTNPAMRGVFGSEWSDPSTLDREATKLRLEAIHGPLTIVESEPTSYLRRK